MAEHKYLIHTDGGSRGNPGPAAYGFVIEGPGFDTVQHGEYIGHATNNVAEYSAVIAALKKLNSLLGEKAAHSIVRVHADSELLVKQLNGEYRVKHPKMRELFIELSGLLPNFSQVIFQHIRREQNKGADRMVNHALDRQAGI